MTSPTTSFETKCAILGQLWSEYQEEEEWEEFCSYSNMGLPLAFCLDTGLVENPSPLAKLFVEQSFTLLLKEMGLADIGWQSFEDMLDEQEIAKAEKG
jgi:hypothetical protein